MAKSKVRVRRIPAAAASDFNQCMVRPFKIKEMLPQEKKINTRCKKKIKAFQAEIG